MNVRAVYAISVLFTLSIATLIDGIPKTEATDGYWLNGEYFAEDEELTIAVTLHTRIPDKKPYLYIFATITNFDEQGFESVACTFRQTDDLLKNFDSSNIILYNYQGAIYLPQAKGAASGVGSTDFVKDGIWEMNYEYTEMQKTQTEMSYTCAFTRPFISEKPGEIRIKDGSTYNFELGYKVFQSRGDFNPEPMISSKQFELVLGSNGDAGTLYVEV